MLIFLVPMPLHHLSSMRLQIQLARYQIATSELTETCIGKKSQLCMKYLIFLNCCICNCAHILMYIKMKKLEKQTKFFYKQLRRKETKTNTIYYLAHRTCIGNFIPAKMGTSHKFEHCLLINKRRLEEKCKIVPVHFYP